MKISKFPLCLCALALCASVTVRADDTAAQAAARAALMQKMQEIQGGAETTPQTPAPAESAPAAAPATAAPAAVAPAETAAPAAMTSTPAAAATAQSGDTPAQAAARAAMAAKMSELGSSEATATSTAAATVQSGDTADQAAARVAMEAKMSQLGPSVTPANVAISKGKIPSARSMAMQGTPIVAPALPISMSKEEKLAQLLGQYKNNQISPLQYHEQRAAILAEP